MNIYVGNLSFQTTEDELRRVFENYGQVSSASIIKDKYSGESRGFGFVEMETQSEAESAIEGLNGSELGGRAIVVNEARPRTEDSRGGGGDRRRGGRDSGDRGGRRSW